jgi:uncharacterized protein
MPASTIESNEFLLDSHTLKPSQYNTFVHLDNDRYYGYNVLYDSLIQLRKESFSKIADRLNNFGVPVSSEVLENDLGKATLDALLKSNFVIDASISELSIVKHLHNSAVYSDNAAHFVVLPTTNCNFNCPYCYECKNPTTMSRDMEDHFIRFVETRFPKKRNIHISWFGGEPLLAFDTILRISDRMNTFCDSIHSTYSSNLTTNGYYLNQAFFDNLAKTNINNIQVTLDGDKHYHDLIRHTKSGKGSFERIRENIIRFCETVSENECTLTIRVNLCDRSYNSAESLLDRFPDSVKERCTIYFRMIYDNVEAQKRGHANFSSKIAENGVFDPVGDVTTKARMAGWRTLDPFIKRTWTYCDVDLKDHYTINPNGDVFLCDHDTSPSMCLFNIASADCNLFQKSNALQAKWLSLDPFSDKECVECKILPLCQGGCRLARYRGGKSCMKNANAEQFVLSNAIKEKLRARASRLTP